MSSFPQAQPARFNVVTPTTAISQWTILTAPDDSMVSGYTGTVPTSTGDRSGGSPPTTIPSQGVYAFQAHDSVAQIAPFFDTNAVGAAAGDVLGLKLYGWRNIHWASKANTNAYRQWAATFLGEVTVTRGTRVGVNGGILRPSIAYGGLVTLVRTALPSPGLRLMSDDSSTNDEMALVMLDTWGFSYISVHGYAVTGTPTWGIMVGSTNSG